MPLRKITHLYYPESATTSKKAVDWAVISSPLKSKTVNQEQNTVIQGLFSRNGLESAHRFWREGPFRQEHQSWKMKFPDPAGPHRFSNAIRGIRNVRFNGGLRLRPVQHTRTFWQIQTGKQGNSNWGTQPDNYGNLAGSDAATDSKFCADSYLSNSRGQCRNGSVAGQPSYIADTERPRSGMQRSGHAGRPETPQRLGFPRILADPRGTWYFARRATRLARPFRCYQRL